MRPSSGRRARLPLSRDAAWAYFSTNLALPGFGSLAARRLAGWLQAPLCVVAVVLTLGFGLRFTVWYFTHRDQLDDPTDDPVATLAAIWANVRWALLGMGLFALNWIWALFTSLSLMQEAKRTGPTVPADPVPAASTKAR